MKYFQKLLQKMKIENNSIVNIYRIFNNINISYIYIYHNNNVLFIIIIMSY